MKKLSLWVMAFTLFMLGACGSDKGDMGELLKTVPSSAGAVIGIDIKEFIKDAGCSLDDNVIKPGKELSALIDGLSSTDKADVMKFVNGDTGVALESAVIFYDSGRALLTFLLYDTNKFKSFIENEAGGSFSEENGVKLMNNLAWKGDQVWVCLSPNRRIDPDGINSYASLSEGLSFYSKPQAKIILESDDNVIGWGNFNSIAQNFLNRNSATMASLATGLLFDDVDAASFSLDFDKGELEIEMAFLDSKGEPAKYLLPTEKINPKAINQLSGNCDVLFAFTITPETIKKVEKLGSALGGSLFGDFNQMFQNINGTIAVALGESYESVAGVISTTGTTSSDLKDALAEFCPSVSEEGNYLKFSKGEISGPLSIEASAALLKDYCIGATVNLEAVARQAQISSSVASAFSTFVMGFKPDNGSIKYNIEIKSSDPGQNILITFLKNLK